MINRPRYPLAIGFTHSRAARVLTMLLLGALLVPVAGCLGWAAGLLCMFAIMAVAPNAPGEFAYLPFATVGVLAVAAAVYVGSLLVVVLRRSAWLDGTRLSVQLVRTRTVDLATARTAALRPTRHALTGPRPAGVWAAWPTGTVPELVINGADRTVRLPLTTGERVLLPSAQLYVIAAALSRSPAHGAADVAAWLHATAATHRG